jgi:hypothetical protein
MLTFIYKRDKNNIDKFLNAESVYLYDRRSFLFFEGELRVGFIYVK